jgi:hypothetical protein
LSPTNNKDSMAPRLPAPPAAHDALLGYGSLITVLVALHVAALLFWIGMTVFGDRKKGAQKQAHQD